MTDHTGPAPASPTPAGRALGTLTWAEIDSAALVGVKRQINEIWEHWNDQRGPKVGDDNWKRHIEDAVREMAAAKAAGTYWGAPTRPVDGDVRNDQVRTRSKDDDFELIIDTTTCPKWCQLPVRNRATMATPIPVNLSTAEMYTAAMTGVLRDIEAKKQRRTDKHGANADKDIWRLHVNGAVGERAFAKAADRYWGTPVNTYKVGGDVGKIQVRTRSERWHDLIVRDDDRDTDAFVLVLGRAPHFHVLGWILARDARRAEWLKEHGGREAAHFVPQSALRPLDELVGGHESIAA